MRINRIKIKNIRSYENAEINFPLGSVLLSGDIGSGKSSILLATEFALFGLQPGQKGSSLLKNGKENGLVELEFEIGDKKITLTRTLKRRKSITQDASFITINGETKEKAVTELKNDVLNLINYPSEFSKKTNLLYRYTVYTPQEEMKQIILENPEIRLNTLRHVFGIDKYKRIKENSVIFLQKIKELVKIKQGQVFDLEETKLNLELKKNQLVDIEKNIPQINIEINEVKLKKDDKKKEIEEIQDKIFQKKALENELEKNNIFFLTKNEQAIRIKKEIEEIKNHLKETSKNFDKDKLEKIIIELSNKKSQIEKLKNEVIKSNTQIMSLDSKKQEIYHLKEKMIHLKNCPTCLQEVSQNHKNNILSETDRKIIEINSEKIKIDNEKQKIEITIMELESFLNELEKERKELEKIKIIIESTEKDSKKLIDLEKSKELTEKDLNLLEEQKIILKNSIFELKKFDNIFQLKEKEFSEIAEKQKRAEIKKAEIEKEIQLINIQIKELESLIEKKEEIKKQLDYLSELEEWISENFLDMISFIEKNVMLKLRDEFSKLFSEWFSILVPENFIVRLDDDFTPIIEQQGFEIDYTYLSGGEKTAIALAYRLALNQTINSVLSEIRTKGLVILDEPTDGFSQQQLDKMRDVLQELDVEQLIIVSHDQKIESFVDNIIRLKKEQGSTIVN